jgi:hypothetical protein
MLCRSSQNLGHLVLAPDKGAYRSTSASHACRSPLLARFTRSTTTESMRLRLASSVRLGFVVMVMVAWRLGRTVSGFGAGAA